MLNKLAETVTLHIQSQLFQTLPHGFRLPQIFLPLRQTLRYYLKTFHGQLLPSSLFN